MQWKTQMFGTMRANLQVGDQSIMNNVATERVVASFKVVELPNGDATGAIERSAGENEHVVRAVG